MSTIRYDDQNRTVTYDADGKPSAEGTADDFVDDFFGESGRFTVPTGEHLAKPWAPWFDSLPAELDLELPSVTTANDIVSAAITQATPSTPAPLMPDGDVARRTTESIIATSTPQSIPVAGDRLGSISVRPRNQRLGLDAHGIPDSGHRHKHAAPPRP